MEVDTAYPLMAAAATPVLSDAKPVLELSVQFAMPDTTYLTVNALTVQLGVPLAQELDATPVDPPGICQEMLALNVQVTAKAAAVPAVAKFATAGTI